MRTVVSVVLTTQIVHFIVQIVQIVRFIVFYARMFVKKN